MLIVMKSSATEEQINVVKNTIEKYGGWTEENAEQVRNEVYLKLEQGGYQTVVMAGTTLRERCATKVYGSGYSDEEYNTVIYPEEDDNPNRRYEFCVIRHPSSRGNYYQVVTYMRFEIPVIGSVIHPAIFGETAVLYNNVNDAEVPSETEETEGE